MDFITPSMEGTDDGTHTLRHPVIGEAYHSSRGAVGESMHVFIANGFDLLEKPSLNVFEMGFGSGLNALLTLKRAQERGVKVVYHAVEMFPVELSVIKQLNYVEAGDPLYSAYMHMHGCDWGIESVIHNSFTLKKYHCSLFGIDFDTIFDLIYFDAFSPDVQPELWTPEVFRRLYEHTAQGGILSTYSSKGSVKRALREAGYSVKRVEGALGKRHMLVAVKE